VGTNTASKREELRSKTNGKVKIGSFEDAAKFGEIVVVATKGTAAEGAVKAAGIANLNGKTVIDATNPNHGRGDNRQAVSRDLVYT
jgi:predicted dinucleotide-binding enzyme